MRKKFLSLLVVFAMVVSFLTPLGSVKGAATASISPIYYYAPYDGTSSGGTPIAYYVTLTGANPSTQYYVGAWFYSSSSAAYFWNWATSQWMATPGTIANYPVITTDNSGKWSGWIIVKTKTETDLGGAPYFRVRFYLQSNTGNTIDATSQNTINFMNMHVSGVTPPSWVTTDGGWIEGYAYDTNGNPLQNATIVVKNSSGTIVGMYKTEDNTVNEGYPTTAGYYKVACPVGTGYSVEVWDSSNNIIGVKTTDVYVKAGQVTTNVNINSTVTSYPPNVYSTNPANGATNVPVNTTISVQFTKPMDSSTIIPTNFELKDSSSTVISGSVSYDNSTNTAKFTPLTNLSVSTTYTFTIKSQVKDTSGQPMPSDYVITFTTQAPGPQVLSTNPANGATNVPVTTTISATFDKDIDTSTLSTSTFTLKDSSNNPVNGTVTYDSTSKTATFTPSSNLQASTTYTATLSGTIKDTNGNLMGSDYS